MARRTPALQVCLGQSGNLPTIPIPAGVLSFASSQPEAANDPKLDPRSPDYTLQLESVEGEQAQEFET